jgi:hypothetical protein
MPITYDALVADKSTAGSIKYWCNHDSIDAAGALILAEAWIYQRLRASEMRTEATIDLDEDEMNVDLPDDYLAPITFQWRGDSDPIAYVHEALLARFRDDVTGEAYAGRPTRYAIFTQKFQFELQADEDLTADFIYYAIPEALSGSNLTNFLTRRFPALLRATCEAYGYEDRKRLDEAKAQFSKASALLEEANATYDRERAGQVLR